MKTEKSVIDSAIASGKNKAQILGLLLIEGYSEAAAKDAIKAAGLGRERSGFRAELYAALESGPVDEKEFAKMISGATKNVKKYESHYNEIRLLANRVRELAAKPAEAEK